MTTADTVIRTVASNYVNTTHLEIKANLQMPQNLFFHLQEYISLFGFDKMAAGKR